jgi:hypothetical protein
MRLYLPQAPPSRRQGGRNSPFLHCLPKSRKSTWPRPFERFPPPAGTLDRSSVCRFSGLRICIGYFLFLQLSPTSEPSPHLIGLAEPHRSVTECELDPALVVETRMEKRPPGVALEEASDTQQGGLLHGRAQPAFGVDETTRLAILHVDRHISRSWLVVRSFRPFLPEFLSRNRLVFAFQLTTSRRFATLSGEMDASSLSETMETTRQHNKAQLTRGKVVFLDLLAQGQHRKAVTAFKKVIELASDPPLGLGSHDLDVLDARELLAKTVAARFGQHQAITEYEALLQLREEAHGAGSQLTCATRQELAGLLWADTEESADSGVRASALIVKNMRIETFRLQAFEKVKDTKLISEVLSWSWIQSLGDVKDLDDARRWLHDILRLREEEYGPRNPITEVPRRKYAAVLLKLGEFCGLDGKYAAFAKRYFQEAKKLAIHNTSILTDAKFGNDRRIQENEDLIKRSEKAEQRLDESTRAKADAQSGPGDDQSRFSLGRSQTFNEEASSAAHKVRPDSPLPDIRAASTPAREAPRPPPPLPPRHPGGPGDFGPSIGDSNPTSRRYPGASQAANMHENKLGAASRHDRHHHRSSTGPRSQSPRPPTPSQIRQPSGVTSTDPTLQAMSIDMPIVTDPWNPDDAWARRAGIAPGDALDSRTRDFRQAGPRSETREYNENVLHHMDETNSPVTIRFSGTNMSSPAPEASQLSSATSISAPIPQQSFGPSPSVKGRTNPMPALKNLGEPRLAGPADAQTPGSRRPDSAHFLKLAEHTNDSKGHKRAKWLDHQEYNLFESLDQSW